ncbi:MAG: hypothetical protein M1162_04010 [Candidatus Thermoplasmatota archaeon]|nr:hypothetical protein [Candidatus Thermoplasmatota archaeon]
METSLKQQVINWLIKGKENAERLVDLPWKIEDNEGILSMENEKVPFVIYALFKEKTIQFLVDTGIETATISNKVRFATYRILLILNRQLDLVKFMLDGTNENLMARIDLENSNLTKKELDEAMNILLSSIYLMVKELNLEDQFNQRIIERMCLMIEGMEREGKSSQEILSFLTSKIGVREEEARNLLQNVNGTRVMSKEEEEMYG